MYVFKNAVKNGNKGSVAFHMFVGLYLPESLPTSCAG